MVGFDTGFSVELMKGDSKPVEFWASQVDRDTLPVISILTPGELLYISFGLRQPKKVRDQENNIDKSARVVLADRFIVEKAISLKTG